MATNINRVVLTGNLTADPELRSTTSGTQVASLRVAVNERVKQNGEWTDRANYFNVTVFGAQGENAARYLSKGRGVAVDGRLRWREYEATEGGRRQAVEIIAENVQYLSSPNGNGNGSDSTPDTEADPESGSGVEDDIPF